MTGINHLQEAKKMDEYYRLEANPEEEDQVLKWIQAHALIAIAEQLEKMNNKNDINTRWHE